MDKVARGKLSLLGSWVDQLVWMILASQPSEAALYATLIGAGCEAKVCVEVAMPLKIPISFVDGVGKVGEDDEDEDVAMVADEAWTAGLGLWVTGADCSAVVYCLQPVCNKL